MLLFRGKNQQPILLRDVARFDMGTGPAHMVRENQGLGLPDQCSLICGSQWETIQETNRELMSVIALFLVLVVLAVQYKRLTNPLVILAAAPPCRSWVWSPSSGPPARPSRLR